MAERQLTLPGEIVKKSNALARAKWSPKSVWEPRMVALVASMVRQDDEDFQEYRFPAAKLCEEESLSGKRYRDIKTAVENVMKAYVMLEEGKNYMAYSIFSKCGYENGHMVAAFHPDLKPHFLGLQKQFTKYSLMEFLVLPSTYSQRIYEVLKSWNDKPEVTIALADLHEMVGAPPSMRKKYPDFRRKVLEKAHKDINKHTALSYEWHPIKQGRKIGAIRFVFSIPRKAETKKTNEVKAEKDRSAKDNRLFIKAGRCFKAGNCQPEDSNLCRFCKETFH